VNNRNNEMTKTKSKLEIAKFLPVIVYLTVLSCSTCSNSKSHDDGEDQREASISDACGGDIRYWYAMRSGTSQRLKGVRTDNEGRVWVVGNNGVVLRYEGDDWQIDEVLNINTLDAIEYHESIGIVAAGWNYENETVNSMSSGNTTTRVYRLIDNRWTRLDPGFLGRVRGLGLSDRDIVVVGTYVNDGRIWSYRDNTWIEETGNKAPFDTIYEIFPLEDGSEIMITGDQEFSQIVERREKKWRSLLKISAFSRLNEVVVSTKGTIFTVGHSENAKGLIIQGSVDTLEGIEVSESELRSISVLSEDNIYVAGNNGSIAHYDGKNWNLMDSGTTADLFGIWASKETGDVYAVGDAGTILQYTCPKRFKKPEPTAYDLVRSCNDIRLVDTSRELYGVWGISRNDFYVAGGGGVYRIRESNYEVAWTRSNVRFNAMRGNDAIGYAVGHDASSGHTLVVACGVDGCIERPTNIAGSLQSVWVSPDKQELITAGSHWREAPNESLVLRYGEETDSWDTLEPLGHVVINQLWGETETNIWAAGTEWSEDGEPSGVVFHFDGRFWTRKVEQNGMLFYAVHGSEKGIFAGGAYYPTNDSRNFGVLLEQRNDSWVDTELDKDYAIFSLYVRNGQLIAGTRRIVEPTTDRFYELTDMSNPAAPKMLCKESNQVEDINQLVDGTIVAVGQQGAVYLLDE